MKLCGGRIEEEEEVKEDDKKRPHYPYEVRKHKVLVEGDFFCALISYKLSPPFKFEMKVEIKRKKTFETCKDLPPWNVF